MKEICVICEDCHLIFSSDSEVDVDIYYGEDASNTVDNKKFLLNMVGNRIVVNNPDLGKRLFFLICSKKDESYVISTRLVELDGTDNFRDCGGYKTNDGRIVKWGLLYRSDQLSDLSNRDIVYLQDMGLKTIVDYRSLSEAKAAPNRVITQTNTFSLDPNAKIAQLAAGSIDDKNNANKSTLELLKANIFDLKKYGDPEENMLKEYKKFIHSSSSRKAYKELFELILDSKNLPLVQHCRGGKDRTGFGVAIILLAIGVKEEDVIYDYELTTLYRSARNSRQMALYKKYTDDVEILTLLSTMQKSKAIYMKTAIDEMKNSFGSIDLYLENVLGINKENKEKLKKILLY